MNTRHFFKINGLDILPYIAQGGLKITQNDVDSPQAGRTLDGKMHRGKVTSKIKFEIQCIPLSPIDVSRIYSVLDHEYVTVTTDISPVGADTLEMYNSTRPASCLIVDSDDIAKWDGINFNLIER